MALNKIHYDIGGNRAACGTFSYRNHDMYPLNDFLDSESPAKCKRCAVLALDAAIKLDSEIPAQLAPDKSRI